MADAGSRRAARFLRTTGQHAAIEPDAFTDGAYVLSIGGAEQSHVNLAHPEEIFYEYLRRIGHLVDLAAPPEQPVRALHLGAGALTLARYIQATRPGSVQYAVELERELLDFVLQQLPLPEGTDLHTVIGDAREALAELARTLQFDVVILDIFSGPEAPAHIACAEFYQEVRATAGAPGRADRQRGRRARRSPWSEARWPRMREPWRTWRPSPKPACSQAATRATSSWPEPRRPWPRELDRRADGPRPAPGEGTGGSGPGPLAA